MRRRSSPTSCLSCTMQVHPFTLLSARRRSRLKLRGTCMEDGRGLPIYAGLPRVSVTALVVDTSHAMVLCGLPARGPSLLLYAGFEGRYTIKAGKTAEGSATFFRRSRYRAVALREVKMNGLFADILADPAAHAIHSQFLPLLQSSPNLVKALSRVRLHSPLPFLREHLHSAAALRVALCVVGDVVQPVPRMEVCL